MRIKFFSYENYCFEARKWFAHFRSGNCGVEDELRSGRLITEKSNEILEKIEQDRHISSHDIFYELSIHHQAISNHLKKAGFKKKLNVWVPYQLSVKNKMNRHTHTCTHLW